VALSTANIAIVPAARDVVAAVSVDPEFTLYKIAVSNHLECNDKVVVHPIRLTESKEWAECSARIGEDLFPEGETLVIGAAATLPKFRAYKRPSTGRYLTAAFTAV
jgi:hypothetical protein